MVGLLFDVLINFLGKERDWVSDEEMCNVLRHQVIQTWGHMTSMKSRDYHMTALDTPPSLSSSKML